MLPASDDNFTVLSRKYERRRVIRGFIVGCLSILTLKFEIIVLAAVEG